MAFEKRVTDLVENTEINENDYLLISKYHQDSKYRSRNARVGNVLEDISSILSVNISRMVDYLVDDTDFHTHTVPLSNMLLVKNTAHQLDTRKEYDFFYPSPFTDILICENDEEVELCKQQFLFNMQYVFDNWKRFAHCDDQQVDVTKTPSEYTAWVKQKYNANSGYSNWSYDSTNNTILQSVDSKDFSGFVSNRKYFNYKFTIRCYSTNSDDDFNGIVAAFATDELGYQHTLSFIRTSNSTNDSTQVNGGPYHWYVALDLNNDTTLFNPTTKSGPSTLDNYKSKLISNGSQEGSSLGNSRASGCIKENSGGWNSSTVKGGTLISVHRNGNVFTGRTTQFSSSVPSMDDLDFPIYVDLDQLLNSDIEERYKKVLKLFTKPCSIGYCNCSQPQSRYENWELPGQDAIIADLANQKMWKYDYSIHDWSSEVIKDRPKDYISDKVIYYNKFTKKCWMKDYNFYPRTEETSDRDYFYIIYDENYDSDLLITHEELLIADEKDNTFYVGRISH